MSSETTCSVLFREMLERFLMEYDKRVGPEQARVLVVTHKCRWCRISFADLSKGGQSLVFLEDSRRAVHDLCPRCATQLRETDGGAREIELPLSEDDSRRGIIFGIMVGELKHTQFKGTSTESADLSAHQDDKPDGVREKKPVFVRRHPARRDMATVGRR